MLFMTIFTYEPAQRDEVVAKRMEGFDPPEGVKVIGQWSSTSGGRAFTLSEADNALVMAGWSYEWSGLGKMEVIPVVETQELMDAMKAK